MKNISLILIIFSQIIYSQEWTELNTIVTINNEVLKNQLNIEFIHKNNDTINTYKSIFLPGKLKIKTADFEKIKNSENTIVGLKITAITTNKDKVIYKEYIINNIKISLLIADYFILKIYDLTNKEFKKKYFPIDGTTYTFEYDSPIETIRRVRRKS